MVGAVSGERRGRAHTIVLMCPARFISCLLDCAAEVPQLRGGPYQ